MVNGVLLELNVAGVHVTFAPFISSSMKGIIIAKDISKKNNLLSLFEPSHKV